MPNCYKVPRPEASLYARGTRTRWRRSGVTADDSTELEIPGSLTLLPQGRLGDEGG